MPSETPKPPRKQRAPRRDFKAERDRLVMHCRVAIDLLNAMLEAAGKSVIEDPVARGLIEQGMAYQKGQIAALKAVLGVMGESVAP